MKEYKEKELKVTKKITKHFDFESAKKKVKGNKIKIENYDQFKNPSNSRYNKLRQRTIKLIKLDKNMIKTSVQSIINYNRDEKQNLYLQIELNQQPSKYCQRPKQIELPFPIYGKDSKFCLFVKKQEQLEQIIGLTKVIDLNQFQKQYPKDQDKKQFIKNFDAFFCEIDLYEAFQKNLGKVFYELKKYLFIFKRIPFPIKIEDLKNAYQYTYFNQGPGPQYNVRMGNHKMDLQQLFKNVIHCIYNTVPYILLNSQKHSYVKQVLIKTLKSIGLPVYKNDIQN